MSLCLVWSELRLSIQAQCRLCLHEASADDGQEEGGLQLV